MYQDDSCIPGRPREKSPWIIVGIWKATGGLCPVKKKKVYYLMSLTILGGLFFFFLQFMGKPEAEVVKNHRKLGKYSKKSNY